MYKHFEVCLLIIFLTKFKIFHKQKSRWTKLFKSSCDAQRGTLCLGCSLCYFSAKRRKKKKKKEEEKGTRWRSRSHGGWGSPSGTLLYSCASWTLSPLFCCFGASSFLPLPATNSLLLNSIMVSLFPLLKFCHSVSDIFFNELKGSWLLLTLSNFVFLCPKFVLYSPFFCHQIKEH